jgi:hypothetical protein
LVSGSLRNAAYGVNISWRFIESPKGVSTEYPVLGEGLATESPILREGLATESPVLEEGLATESSVLREYSPTTLACMKEASIKINLGELRTQLPILLRNSKNLREGLN